MKPKVFIGSSREGKIVADAIDVGLQHTFEPKVRSAGAFGLSEGNIVSLIREVQASDFGIFVFTPDDVALIRGELLTIARDNIVYELGLFSGALGPDRCFFITPLNTDMHLPSNLLGITAGHYESSRRDQSFEAAVNPVCFKVQEKFRKLGFRHGPDHDRLLEFAVDYEKCGRIREENERIAEREKIFDDMKNFAATHPINKLTLLNKHRLGFYMAISAAIVANPEMGDYDLLLSASRNELPRGQAQHKIIDAMFSLKNAGKLRLNEKRRLIDWSKGFNDPEPYTTQRLKNF